ncbi:hypothetical protein DNTS_030351, partial [Danionella cerebrum]
FGSHVRSRLVLHLKAPERSVQKRKETYLCLGKFYELLRADSEDAVRKPTAKGLRSGSVEADVTVQKNNREAANTETMLQLHFTNDALPDNVSIDFQNLNKFSEPQFVSLTEILYTFLLEPKESENFLHQLTEFAGENGMSAGPLRALMKSVLLLPHGALKRNLSAEQVKGDLLSLGLNEDKASHFSDQWRVHYPALTRLAVGQTLMVNQLVDMEWKFGVTVGTSEIQKTGNIFLQVKLTLPQFYNFLHEMERAKACMDCFS